MVNCKVNFAFTKKNLATQAQKIFDFFRKKVFCLRD